MGHTLDRRDNLDRLYGRLFYVDFCIPGIIPEPPATGWKSVCRSSPNRDTCSDQIATNLDSQPHVGNDTHQYTAPNVYAAFYRYAFLACAAHAHTQTDQHTQGAFFCDREVDSKHDLLS